MTFLLCQNLRHFKAVATEKQPSLASEMGVECAALTTFMFLGCFRSRGLALQNVRCVLTKAPHLRPRALLDCEPRSFRQPPLNRLATPPDTRKHHLVESVGRLQTPLSDTSIFTS